MISDDTIEEIKDLGLKGEFPTALKVVQKLEEEYGSHDPSLVKLYAQKAWILMFLGETEESLGVANVALQIIQESNLEGVKKEEARLYMVIGNTIDYTGGTNSLENYLKGEEIYKELGDEEGIASVMNNLGNYYSSRMMINKALEYYNKSIAIYEKISKHIQIAHGLSNIGETLVSNGDLDTALIYLDKFLEYRNQMGIHPGISNTLSLKIEVYLRKNQRDKVPIILSDMEQLAISSGNKFSIQIYELSKALYLKSSKRNFDKAKAEELLRKIIDEPIIYVIATFSAMRHLIELLLYEYKTYEEEEVLNEIKDLIDKMYHLASKRQEYKVLIDTLILQSRLKQFENEFQDAEEILNKAITLAQDIESPVLLANVQSEKENVSQNLSKLQNIINKNQTIAEKFNSSQILDYLRLAQGMIKKDQINP